MKKTGFGRLFIEFYSNGTVRLSTNHNISNCFQRSFVREKLYFPKYFAEMIISNSEHFISRDSLRCEGLFLFSLHWIVISRIRNKFFQFS